jgi:hypothetical protein
MKMIVVVVAGCLELSREQGLLSNVNVSVWTDGGGRRMEEEEEECAIP